jgi:hypothetical protein
MHRIWELLRMSEQAIRGWVKYSPALSKSMQLGILLSNHSRGIAVPEPPEPPKAFVFFLGVTGVLTISEIHHQFNAEGRK